MPASIAIVEDHGLIAHTLATALRADGHEVAVLRPASAQAVVAELGDRTMDVVLLDLDLGAAGNGEDLIAPLAATGAAVAILTGSDDEVRHARSVAAGAVGVLDKGLAFDDLLGAIEQVVTNGTLLSAHERADHLVRLRAHEREQETRLLPFSTLSGREAFVLGALMAGSTADEIARDTVVSVATIRSQVRAIREKLGVSSQVAAIARAREARWVPPQER